MKSVVLAAIYGITLTLGVGLSGCGGVGDDVPHSGKFPTPTSAAVPENGCLRTGANSQGCAPDPLEGSVDQGADTTSPQPEFMPDAALGYSGSSDTNDGKTQTYPASTDFRSLPLQDVTVSQPIGTTIAAFDAAPDVVTAWKFSLGTEYPGAVGSMTQTVGSGGGAAARVDYDLGCGVLNVAPRGTQACGAYVQMTNTLSSPVSVSAGVNPALAFDVRNPQGVAVLLTRVQDSTGQTLQFHPNARNIERPSGENWRRVILPIASSSNHYGGANDGVLHPPIKAIGIGVGDFAELQPAGLAEFDNIALVDAGTFNFTLNATAATAPGSFPQSYVGRMSVNVSSDDLISVEKAKSIGITVVRRDLTWANIEKAGIYDFSRYTKYAENLSSRGMSVLWILAYGHPDHGGGAPISDADRAAFSAFAAATASNFKGKNVVGFEIWNEPNLKSFWSNPDPIAYAKLASSASTAIRAADPNARVIVGSTAGVDMNYSIKVASAVPENLVDAFSVHPYSKPAPENFANSLYPLKASLASLGMNKPIWDTEWGYSSYGDFDASKYGDGNAPAARNRQAVLVLRRVLTDLGLAIPFLNLYNLVDGITGPLDREANFGLLTYPGEEKPSFSGLKTLFSAQSGRAFKGPVLDVPPGVHALRWDGAADRVFAIWSDTVGQTVDVSLPAATSAIRRWNGDAVSPGYAGAVNTVSIKEADGPLFVIVSQ
ncbi:cellulase family glycosylhydrolase [Niveibacterium microcysteis]|uniref:Cellulase family glycosylhydrolase n=1 Tax=Niveibacterium microcysteis TaxID=2811415 RepID=A0ABX7MCQ3_9RHOO|nr:cellulase family glycosylhydrolase [Niveibacterium microcysteis]QSI79038.1 cellulase family glycosylhydrolase [Niveibacterium microcysteis]